MFRRRAPTLDPRLQAWLDEQSRRPVRRGVVVRSVRGVCRYGYTHRRGLAPLLWGVVLYLAAIALWLSPEGGRTGAVLSVAVAVPLWWRGRVRGWKGGHLRPGGWWYHGTVYALAVAWLVLAASIGPGAPMPGVLLVGVLAAGTPWWWHHRIRAYDTTADERVALWETLVSGPNGVLRGSWLTDLADV